MLKKIILIFSVIIFCIIGFVFSDNSKIDFDKILEKSELKEKKFNKMPKEIKTKQGIKAWLIEDTDIDLISLSFSFNKVGTAYDGEDKKGLSIITASMLDGGTKSLDYDAYHEFLELNGISISFGAEKDYFNGSMTTTKTAQKEAFNMLKDVLFETRLDEKYFEIIKNRFLVAVKAQREKPESELGIKFKEEIFGNHPYSRTLETMAEDVKNLKISDVKNFLNTQLNQDSLIIGIAGNITENEAIKLLDDVFGKLPQTSDTKTIDKPILNLEAGTTFIERETAQIVSQFAVLGTTRLAADFYPLYIANHIFGGAGLTSRLSLATREKEGLTYGVYTYLSTDDNTPLILGGFSCVPENYEKMKTILLEQMSLFASKGITEKELINAKRYLLSSFNLRFKSTLELASMLNVMQKSKLGLDFLQKRNDYVKKVTLREVNDAAAKYYKNMPKEVAIGLIK